MTNVLSMDPGDRFRRLMESGLCAAAAGRPLLPGPATTPRRGPEGARWQAAGAPAVGAAQGQRQTGAVYGVLRGTGGTD